MIIGIVCVDKEWGIGYKNNLLFNIKEDMEFFKNQTINKSVLMGLNTYYSIGKALPNRQNFILCPEGTQIDDNVILIHSLEEALKITKTIDLYIIGGATIYSLFLPYYDKVFVTKVPESLIKDTYFPNLDTINTFNKELIKMINYKETEIPVYCYFK